MTAANTPAHILLADDEETFRLSTADLLRQEGYRVTEATSATEARAVLDREPVDLLVSDIRMSGNENLDLVRPMRATPGTPPIILVTGYPSSATAVPALNMAVSAYLAKPLDVEDFLSHVRRAVEQRRAERSLDSLRERAEEWRAELVALERATRTGRGPRAGSLSAFADVTLGTIARSLDDLRRVVDATSGGPMEPSACVALNCPRYAALELAILDAINVLEETKGAFKSRQLGSLRVRLEAVLKDMRVEPA